MKEWREYMSEDDGAWEFLCEINSPENEADIKSINGHDAVMARKAKPSDIVSVTILPCAREIDSVTGRIGHEKEFYIQLECLRDGWICISNEYFKAPEALEVAKIFLGLHKEIAIKVWQSKNLGGLSQRIDYK